MTDRSISQLIHLVRATVAPDSDVGLLCNAASKHIRLYMEKCGEVHELRHSLRLATSNAEICNRVAREAKERCALLEEALRWALENRAGSNYVGGLRNGGCGCCSDDIEPPAHLEPIFRDVLGEKHD